MDKFYIITNRDKDQNLRFTEEIVQYLKDHGKKCQVQQAERKTEGTYHYTDPELIPEFFPSISTVTSPVFLPDFKLR